MQHKKNNKSFQRRFQVLLQKYLLESNREYCIFYSMFFQEPRILIHAGIFPQQSSEWFNTLNTDCCFIRFDSYQIGRVQYTKNKIKIKSELKSFTSFLANVYISFFAVFFKCFQEDSEESKNYTLSLTYSTFFNFNLNSNFISLSSFILSYLSNSFSCKKK